MPCGSTAASADTTQSAEADGGRRRARASKGAAVEAVLLSSGPPDEVAQRGICASKGGGNGIGLNA